MPEKELEGIKNEMVYLMDRALELWGRGVRNSRLSFEVRRKLLECIADETFEYLKRQFS